MDKKVYRIYKILNILSAKENEKEYYTKKMH